MFKQALRNITVLTNVKYVERPTAINRLLIRGYLIDEITVTRETETTYTVTGITERDLKSVFA